jgi:Arc/MetJ-type ribon-helix-helix transcriptional regulator
MPDGTGPASGSPTGQRCDRQSGMVSGMADTQKVTITLPVATVDQVRRLVEAGQASSISGFVQHAVGVALDDVVGWASALSEALASTGGELSAQERAWADSVLDLGQQTGAA